MDSGAYQINIKITKKTDILVGALGRVVFEQGIYIYTGSAMKNLGKRIERHKRKEKKLHWHIDYLLNSKNAKIIKIDVFPSASREECELNENLIKSGNFIVHKIGFGSSDCRYCKTHLLKLIQ